MHITPLNTPKWQCDTSRNLKDRPSSDHGNVDEIIGNVGRADQLREPQPRENQCVR